MTVFDPKLFGQTEIVGQNDTIRPYIEDGEYPAIVDSYDFRQYDRKDGPGKSTFMDLLWSVDDAKAREVMNREKVLVRQSIGLDLTSDGNLDMGKGRNVNLGRLREALGLNRPGQPFKFDDFVGRTAKIKVTTRKDGDDTYNDVKGVTAL